MKSIFSIWFGFLILLATLVPSHAHAAVGPAVQTGNAEARLVAKHNFAVPGEAITVGLHLNMRDGWHTYWRNAGDAGLPTMIDWDLPVGVSASEISWPLPKRIKEGEMITVFGYSEEITLLSEISVPQDFPQDRLRINAKASWLICEKVCIPESADLTLSLPVIQATPQPSQVAYLINQARLRIPTDNPETVSFTRNSNQTGDVIQIVLPQDPLLHTDEQVMALPTYKTPEPVVYFFPINEDVVDYNLPQSVQFTESHIILSQPVSSFFQSTDTFSFVTKSLSPSGEESFTRWRASYQSTIPDLEDVPVLEDDSTLLPEISGALLLQAILFAFLGGLILNLMPCVFPVLSIKVLSYVKKAGKERSAIRAEGLAYTAGVLVTFLAIAGLLIALKQAGQELGWGFQLQSPQFVAILAYLMFFLGLSLSGVIDIGTKLMGLGAHLAGDSGSSGKSSGKKGAFFTGLLAVIVATPCTAPFMGFAIGFALAHPAPISLLIFTSLGLGMAAPYLALTWFPNLLKYLPKPGAWMDTFKEAMAFPMYLTAVWLVWVLSFQVSSFGVGLVLLGLVLIAFAAWLASRFRGRGKLTVGLAVLSVLLAFGVIPQLGTMAAAPQQGQSESANWIPFSEATLDKHLSAGDKVFVNMTAAWCITCLANEQVALSATSVKDAFAKESIVYLKGDWTNYDDEITRYLESYNRQGVPLYVYYEPGQAPQLLPQLLTPGIVLGHITPKS